MKSFKQYDEATNVNKQDVPVYAPIKGKKGHYEIIGHIRQSATSVGAAKVGKKHGAKSAYRTMNLKSKEYPEGPGWVIKSHVGPMKEAYTAANVIDFKTHDLGSVYKWLKWGNAAKTGLTEKDPTWAKQRDAIGSELGKRARGGEELAKRALNKRMDSSVDKYGKSIPAIRTPPTPNLLQKIAKALRGK